MSSANSRPLPPRPPSKRTASESGERSTGVRARIPSEPVIKEAPAPPNIGPTSGSQAEGIRNNSIAPEALRKPYASLAPQAKKRSDTSPKRSATPAVRSQAPSTSDMSWDENSSLTSSRSRPSRAVCKKHKLAVGKDGECMLCKKESASEPSSLGWKLMVALVAVAVIGGGIIAAMV